MPKTHSYTKFELLDKLPNEMVLFAYQETIKKLEYDNLLLPNAYGNVELIVNDGTPAVTSLPRLAIFNENYSNEFENTKNALKVFKQIATSRTNYDNQTLELISNTFWDNLEVVYPNMYSYKHGMPLTHLQINKNSKCTYIAYPGMVVTVDSTNDQMPVIIYTKEQEEFYDLLITRSEKSDSNQR